MNSETIRKTHRRFAEGLDYHRQFLDAYLPPEGNFADVGCGVARVSAYYSDGRRRFVGYDLDADTLALVRQALPASPPLVVANAFRLPVPDESLDGYIGLGILELDGNGGRTGIAEARRALKPGGLLYVTVPYKNMRRRLGGETAWRGLDLPSFGVDDLTTLFRANSFEPKLLRPSSIAHGIGPFGALSRVCRDLLVREREDSISYRALSPILRLFANSLLGIAIKR